MQMGEHSTSNAERRTSNDSGRQAFLECWALNVACSMFPFRAFVLALLLFGSNHAFATTNSPLADAVEKQDHAAFRKLLKQHVDVNASQADGMTALHWAAYLDDLEAAKSLAAANASVNATNRYGVAPLSLACQNGNTEMVELLLARGADPNMTLRGGETALMTAARTGKPEAVKSLLLHRAIVDAKEQRGQTALMWAAAEGHVGVVELLLKAGADLHVTLPDSGFTPLLFAVREGRTEVVRTLLKAGADVNEAMQPRKTSLKSPAKGTSALILAVENGHFELAMLLLDAGADPNDQRSGFTALHVMTWVRKPPRGEDYGAPPPLGSGNLNSLQFIRKLVAHGADVNARLQNGKGGPGSYNRTGATPFLMAASTADVPYMRLLVELGGNPRQGNVDNCTPLMVACGIGVGGDAANEVAGEEPEVLEAAQLTLDLGVDINAVDANGETAMHGAAYKNLPKVIQFLADKGAKIEIWNQKNKYGWTPLLIAQGYRPGNFKPSAETIEALQRVMLAAGVVPTSAPPTTVDGPEEYKAESAKKPVQ
jgi:ankyrin repeat protein